MKSNYEMHINEDPLFPPITENELLDQVFPGLINMNNNFVNVGNMDGNMIPITMQQNTFQQQQNIPDYNNTVAYSNTWNQAGTAAMQQYVPPNFQNCIQTPPNMIQLKQEEEEEITKQLYMSMPLLILTLEPYPGMHNFSVQIPSPIGKNKWLYCTEMKRLYTKKDDSFEVNISYMRTTHRTNSVLIMPIFEETNKRLHAVRKCPSCRDNDPDQSTQEHIVKVEGSECKYVKDEARRGVEIPLDSNTSEAAFFLKMSCRTSCPGGPNRHPFVLLFLLIDQHRSEVGRSVLRIKCCESPVRDRKTDLKIKHNKEEYQKNGKNTQEDQEQISKISSSISVIPNKVTKRKVESDVHAVNSEVVNIEVPKKYERKVKSYVNMLLLRDENKKQYCIPKMFSGTDTE